MDKVRIHIGHHFFGAGNIGDDLMLAGFARSAAPFLNQIQLTCCIPPDPSSQILRFPFVEWRSYDFSEREANVAQCDVWLGLGDSPFQSAAGSWFSDHLRDELRWCARYRKPMYFLGVGVNDCEALENPDILEVLSYAAKIWTRDARSLRLIHSANARCHAVEASDLANIELAARHQPQLASGEVGFVLNFEALPGDFPVNLARITTELTENVLVWMKQEVRALRWSESTLFDLLPEAAKNRFVRREPDYLASDLTALLDTLSGPDLVITSRYHAALIAAWQGARVALFCRSEKLRGLAEHFDMSTFEDFSIEAIKPALARSSRVSRELLQRAAVRAEEAVQEFFDTILCATRGVASVDSRRSGK
jgi:polysaccharide pyruvyl transferase WcaK-like protein